MSNEAATIISARKFNWTGNSTLKNDNTKARNSEVLRN